MKTIILNIPEAKEKWFRTLFAQFKLDHKVLSAKTKEGLILAKLIDEEMEEKGEVDKEKILQFVRKNAV
ncbi:MAG TPA: hypothetical protein PKN75_01880 [Bacteroidia bacterium]|nr:hypothetical protein [Bacteroidia bacterium]HNU32324.1 hypothetical protein [Bacteroidia bacterium]